MTKRREPLTYHAALTVIAALIGWDRCGAICGVTDRQVRNWSDPDCEAEIRLIDAERLDRAYMAAGADHAPFHRLFTLRIEIARRDAERRCIAALAGAAAKEGGEAVSAMIEASDDLDNPVARRRMRKEIGEAIDKFTTALAELDQIESQGDQS